MSNQSEAALRARQYYQQGVAFADRGQLSEAVEALQLAVRTMPDHVDARLQLSRVLLTRGKFEEGLRVLDTGLAGAGLSIDEQISLLEQAARCAAAANHYTLARSYLERALEIGADDTEILNYVAAVCCKGGEFANGFDYFLKAAGH